MKTALLVIDYVNGIVEGSCKGYMEKHPLLTNTNKLIAACRERAIPIYFIRLAFDAHYTNIPKHSRGFNRVKTNNLFQLGNNDTAFVDALNYNDSDIVINKTAASPFHSDGLIESLTANAIECLIFSGLATDNAINIGVREAHDMGYYTLVAEDHVAHRLKIFIAGLLRC